MFCMYFVNFITFFFVFYYSMSLMRLKYSKKKKKRERERNRRKIKTKKETTTSNDCFLYLFVENNHRILYWEQQIYSLFLLFLALSPPFSSLENQFKNKKTVNNLLVKGNAKNKWEKRNRKADKLNQTSKQGSEWMNEQANERIQQRVELKACELLMINHYGAMLVVIWFF